ncbi:hypothetical protein [Aquimarina latercula]|uniref:hypothetical protein n=1 Tax=Aquimarina latercula TaxID=987 RepID=UPI00040ABB85|nr:hypothetical protein [Aquimarina latercula]
MTRFTVKFEDGETRTITAKYIKPEIVKGWWTYDKEGEQPYVYKELDENKNEEEEVSVPLGDTMYFHAEVKGIRAGEELEFQLFDHDHLLWIDEIDPDDSEFPNDPVFKKEKIKQVGDKRIATIEVKLEDSWEPVIQDDHDGNLVSLDHTIELYWRISYKNLSEEYPKDENDDRLRVGYNNRDLWIIPVNEGSSIPEFFDREGNLIVTSFNPIDATSKKPDNEERSEQYDNHGKLIRHAAKKANDMAKATGLEGKIANVIVMKVKIITKSTTLSEINMIKKQVYRETINLTTNEVVHSIGYEVKSASAFVVKDTFSYINITEEEKRIRKSFSEYFNSVDIKEGIVGSIRNARELLRFYDYVQVGPTIHSLFAQGDSSTGIPKPSSVVSIFSTFSGTKPLKWATRDLAEEAAKKTIAETAKRTTTTAALESATAHQAAKVNPMVLASEALTGLGSLFMVADVIATEVTNGMLNDMSAYGKELVHINKHNGLDALESLIERTYADELSDFFLQRNISHEAHCKVMNGEIKTFKELDQFDSINNSELKYTYLILIKDKDTETEKYYIDAVYSQTY